MESQDARFEAVTVVARIGTLPGVRLGRVAAYDFYVPERYPIRDGVSRTQRLFLLLDEAIQLHQPPHFLGENAGSWYVDLVSFAETGQTIEVTDRYIDVVVPSPGRTCRVLDLDEFGDAIEAGALSSTEAIAGLRAFQAFLDRHLNRPDGSAGPWPDFPPAAIAPLIGLPLLAPAD